MFLHEKILTDKNITLILFCFSVFGVAGARFLFFPNETTDYTVYLNVWVDHFRTYGFNFHDTFSNYNFPYLYLLWFGSILTPDNLLIVKIIGLISDIFLAFGIYKIVCYLSAKKFLASVSFVLCLLLPEVLLNSSVWGQSDSLYTAFIVWGVLFALKEKSNVSWLFIGLALSFKIQTIFILPAFIIWFIWKKQSILSILGAIGAFVILLLPAWLAGRNVNQLLFAYTSQVGTSYRDVTVNIPNIAVILGNTNFVGLRSAMIFIAFVLCCVAMLVFIKFRTSFENDRLILLKMVSFFGLLLPYFLPNMLDRYYFVGSIFLFVISLLNYRYWILTIVMQFITIISYSYYFSLSILSDSSEKLPVVSMPILSIFMGLLIVSVTWLHFKDSIRAKSIF